MSISHLTCDVFAVPVRNGKVAGSRTHLFRVNTGQGLFGMNLSHSPIGLLVVGGKQTSLLKVHTSRLQTLAGDVEFGPQVTALIDQWVSCLSASFLSTLPPKDCTRLEVGSGVYLSQEASACIKRGVLWVKHQQGQSQFARDSHLPHLNGKGRWPLSERSWIQALEESIGYWVQTTTVGEQARLHNKLLSDQVIVDEALNQLVATLSPNLTTKSELLVSINHCNNRNC